MPRGVAPIRARRRQSDAKWRASVAMCYNIMKCVIPNYKRQGRKKLSKALTLKETERHIVSLEKKLKELIEERAPQNGSVVMIEKEGGHLVPVTFEDLKHDYALKQIAFFSAGGSVANGRKRYNVPLDIETSLESLSQQSCRLLTLQGSQLEASLPNLYPQRVRHTRENSQQVGDGQAKLVKLLTEPFQDPVHSNRGYQTDHPVSKHQRTPRKVIVTGEREGLQTLLYTTPKAVDPITMNGSSAKSKHQKDMKTPSKACKQLPFSGQTTPSKLSTGFTPVKLPCGMENSDPCLGLVTTPVRSIIGSPLSSLLPQTPGSSCFAGVEHFALSDDEEAASLLCTESIDSMDLDLPFQSLSDCEKESPFDTQELVTIKTEPPECHISDYNDDQEVPDCDKSCLDFDGYLLFHQQNVDHIEAGRSSADTARKLAQMWHTLAAEDRAAYSSMATQDIDSKTLSEDLVSIDLKPLDQDQKDEAMYEGSQEVPGGDCGVHDDLSFSAIPGCEDLGVFYIDTLHKQGSVDENDYSQDVSDYSQVVPEL